MNETFVYDGVEVRKTGRVACREIKTIPGKSQKSFLHEITPVDSDLDWKKWVNPDHLFIVQKDKND